VPDPFPAVDPEWFCRSFRGDYLRVYRARSVEAAEREAGFARSSLGLAEGDLVLDLACGAGRHSAPLAAAGLRVVGLDRSRELLDAARLLLGPAVPLVLADMRRLPFAACFRAVLSFFTSFGYFRDESEDLRVLAEMARVALPGGKLLLDLPDRETTIATLVPESERVEGDGLEIVQRRRITPDGRRVEKEIRVRHPRTRGAGDDESRAGSERAGEERWCESVRLYARDEIVAALADRGWRATELFGDFCGTPWRPGSTPRMIVIARREERE